MRNTNSRSGLALLLVLVGLAGGLNAQEEEDKPIRPEDLLGGGAGAQDPQERIKELFFEVEANLYSLSEHLAEAGAGGSFDEPGDSGIQKLLDQVGQTGKSVTQGIDEILEIAQQMGQQQSSSSGEGEGQPQPGGESPLDKQRSGSSSKPEQTPEGPRPEGQQQGEEQGQNQPKPEPQGQQPGEEQTGPDGEKPNDEGENPEDGENKEGADDNRENGDPAANPRDNDSWGNLPPRTQAVFRNQGGEDLPIQYRDWIDSYYRRLNKAE